MGTTRSDAFVFFGSTGDLARKQIFPALYALAKAGRLEMPIVAAGRKKQSTEALRAQARASLVESGLSIDAATFDAFARKLSWVEVDFGAPPTFARIRDVIGSAEHPLHYVALPPDLFAGVAANLAKVGLMKDARLVLEKPFGHDAASATALSRALHAFLPEDAIFRVDHFLGKEPVENLDYFRAANPVVEQSLHAEQVESVQVTMAEAFGVEGRGKFYDAEGALRDVVQNHLLQIVACLAMDLPAQRDRAALRGARARVLSQVRALSPKDVVRGQVQGYTDEEGVAKDSKTETFVAVKLAIDSPRWKDVPFFVRAGKSLPVTATEALIRWKAPSAPVLEDTRRPAANHLRFRIGPTVAIALGVQTKADGEAMKGEATELVAHRAEANAMAPYVRLLGDAMDGDAALFASKEGVEQSWRIVEPVLGARAPRGFSYAPGTWGPAEAEGLAPPGGWYDPG